MFPQPSFPIIFLANGAQLGRDAALLMESISKKSQDTWTPEEYRFMANIQAASSPSKTF